jgi:phosphatidylglycerophosphate synthase
MDAKQLADLITLSRAATALVVAALGLFGESSALPWIAALIIANWTGDILDGALARRSRHPRRTWIGDHDLAVDMLVSIGLLACLAFAGLADVRLASAYLIAWAVVFRRSGVPRALGMLFQAPIYGYFILVALVQEPTAGRWLVAWIAAAVVLTWPKFPRKVVPGFLAGMRSTLQRTGRKGGSGHRPPQY